MNHEIITIDSRALRDYFRNTIALCKRVTKEECSQKTIDIAEGLLSNMEIRANMLSRFAFGEEKAYWEEIRAMLRFDMGLDNRVLVDKQLVLDTIAFFKYVIADREIPEIVKELATNCLNSYSVGGDDVND